jgi:hypothetical protein
MGYGDDEVASAGGVASEVREPLAKAAGGVVAGHDEQVMKRADRPPVAGRWQSLVESVKEPDGR